MNVLSQVGIYALLTLVASVALRPLVVHWLKERIRAGVDEAVKRRLATLQLDLDKDLERHRSDLAIAAEHIRASLARSTSDFAIYAQRRHDAVFGLFADFLRAETLAGDRTNLPDPKNPEDKREDMTSRVIRARNSAYEAYYHHVLYLPDEVDKIALEARDSFHDLLVEYVAANDTPSVSRGKVRTTMRGHLLALQKVAKQDLSRARPSVPDVLLPAI